MMTMIHTCCIIVFIQLLCFAGASKSGIVGGRESKPHSRPYMASLQISGNHSCGGILIQEDFVLTAAHCKQPQKMTVVLGAHRIDKKEDSQQWIQVADYIPHPNYEDRNLVNDIMLLKLKTKAKLNKYVNIIELPKEDETVPARVKCVVAGWGRTAHGGGVSKVLKEAKEMIQFDDECRHIWKEQFKRKSMICTTFDAKKGGVCQGDSGGPLICNNKPQGITSFTFGCDCADPNYPHVFTKILNFLPWIKEKMQR